MDSVNPKANSTITQSTDSTEKSTSPVDKQKIKNLAEKLVNAKAQHIVEKHNKDICNQLSSIFDGIKNEADYKSFKQGGAKFLRLNEADFCLSVKTRKGEINLIPPGESLDYYDFESCKPLVLEVIQSCKEKNDPKISEEKPEKPAAELPDQTVELSDNNTGFVTDEKLKQPTTESSNKDIGSFTNEELKNQAEELYKQDTGFFTGENIARFEKGIEEMVIEILCEKKAGKLEIINITGKCAKLDDLLYRQKPLDSKQQEYEVDTAKHQINTQITNTHSAVDNDVISSVSNIESPQELSNEADAPSLQNSAVISNPVLQTQDSSQAPDPLVSAVSTVTQKQLPTIAEAWNNSDFDKNSTKVLSGGKEVKADCYTYKRELDNQQFNELLQKLDTTKLLTSDLVVNAEYFNLLIDIMRDANLYIESTKGDLDATPASSKIKQAAKYLWGILEQSHILIDKEKREELKNYTPVFGNKGNKNEIEKAKTTIVTHLNDRMNKVIDESEDSRISKMGLPAKLQDASLKKIIPEGNKATSFTVTGDWFSPSGASGENVVHFANYKIGGGIATRGSVQEEIALMQTPLLLKQVVKMCPEEDRTKRDDDTLVLNQTESAFTPNIKSLLYKKYQGRLIYGKGIKPLADRMKLDAEKSSDKKVTDTTFVEDDSVQTNILSIHAPHIKKNQIIYDYTHKDLQDFYNRTYAVAVATKLNTIINDDTDTQKKLHINTGLLGCGDFGNSELVSYIVQIAAYRQAGIPQSNFYGLEDIRSKPTFELALQIVDVAAKLEWSTDQLIEFIVANQKDLCPEQNFFQKTPYKNLENAKKLGVYVDEKPPNYIAKTIKKEDEGNIKQYNIYLQSKKIKDLMLKNHTEKQADVY